MNTIMPILIIANVWIAASFVSENKSTKMFCSIIGTLFVIIAAFAALAI